MKLKISLLAIIAAFSAHVSFASSSCNNDLSQMRSQINQYSSIKTGKCYAYSVPSSGSLNGSTCTASSFSPNKSTGSWEVGNWGNTLQC